MFRRVFLFLLSLSLSLGEGAVDNRTILSLSLFGGGIVDGNWTTEFAVDKISDNVSTPWNLRLNYSVSNHGKNRRLSVEGVFIDDGVRAADSTSIKMLQVEAKEEKFTGQNCHDREGGAENAVKIVTRQELNMTELNANLETRTKPADYLIVGAALYTKVPTENYTSCYRRLYENQLKYFDGLAFNYLISDDGQVFEGMGWDNIVVYRNGGLGPIALSIPFVKENINDPPSPAAVDKLKKLVRTAICLGKLSPNYRLIPYHLIWEPFKLHADHFEKKGMKEWVQYAADIDLGVNEVGQFPVAFREEYNWTRPLTPLPNLTLPVELVVVMHLYDRCFTADYCILSTKMYSRPSPMSANFHIGDDGRAYEVYGWDYASPEKIRGKSMIIVKFYGEYRSYPPSRRTLNAFNSLLRLGVLWGKLSPNYKVASHRSIYDGDIFISDMLHEEVRKMERYTDEI